MKKNTAKIHTLKKKKKSHLNFVSGVGRENILERFSSLNFNAEKLLKHINLNKCMKSLKVDSIFVTAKK